MSRKRQILALIVIAGVSTTILTCFLAFRNGIQPINFSVFADFDQSQDLRKPLYAKHVSCPSLSELKIAFVTALTHEYEHSCKEPVSQSIPVDFLAYTDKHFHDKYGVKAPNVTYNKWTRIDAEPYRYGLLPRDVIPAYHNSLSNNSHPFNRAKVFKLNLHRLPELQKYHIIIWLDATLQITNPNTAQLMVEYLCDHGRNFVGFEQPGRMNLSDEVVASLGSGKYKTPILHDLPQPIQDVEAHYQYFLSEGFQERRTDVPMPKHHHIVRNTAFLALNMLREDTHLFMEKWWWQNLRYTTQDQLSFIFLAWALNVDPYGLPDATITGDFLKNDLYTKLDHHMRI